MIDLQFAWKKPDCIFIIHPLGRHSPPHYFYNVDSSFPTAFPPLNSHLCCSSYFAFIFCAVMFIVHQLKSSAVPAFPYSCLRLPCWSQIWYNFKGKNPSRNRLPGHRHVRSWLVNMNRYASKLETCRSALPWGWFIDWRAKSYGLLHKCQVNVRFLVQ